MDTGTTPPATRRGELLTLAVLTLGGAALGAFLLDDWAMPRRLAAGATMGAWCGFLLTARRLMMK